MFETAANTYGYIDIIIPNAGITEKMNPAFDDEMINDDGQTSEPNLATFMTNFIGAMYTTKLGLHYLRKNPSRADKAIVMVGSMASFFGIPKAPMYSAAKHGILGFMRSMAYTCQAEGIRINMIAPFVCTLLDFCTD